MNNVIKLAAAAAEMERRGMDGDSLETALHAARGLRKNYTSKDVQKAALIAKTAYEEAGRSGSEGHSMFSELADRPVSNPDTRKLASVVFKSLGAVAEVKEKAAHAAGFMQRMLPSFGLYGAGKGVLFSLGALTGGLIGSSAWAASRALKRSGSEVDALREERDMFVRLSAEVDNELKRRGLKPTPGNVAKVVDYLT